jgi:hypothetical protein
MMWMEYEFLDLVVVNVRIHVILVDARENVLNLIIDVV